VKAIKREVSLLEGKNVVFVLDGGLASYRITKLLEESGHGYIMPLKRNFRIIDYSLELGEVFTYRRRGIRCGRKRTPLGYLYFFENPKLRGEEESLFIAAVERGRKAGLGTGRSGESLGSWPS